MGRGAFVMEQFWKEGYESVFYRGTQIAPNNANIPALLQPATLAAEVTYLSHYKPLHAYTLDEVQASDWFKALGIEPFKISRLPQ